MGLSSAKFLTDLLLCRLEQGLPPSIYVNVTNPKLMDRFTAKQLHSEFIQYTKGLNGSLEVDCLEEPYYYIEQVGQYELLVEKLYTVDDNVLLVSLTPESVVRVHNEELLVDIPMVKEELKKALYAKDVTIKVTY